MSNKTCNCATVVVNGETIHEITCSLFANMPLARPVVQWDRPMLKRFKKAYPACDGEVFTFDGNEFLKGYAKYLIEYLGQ